ncbi:MAG: HesA/MoeB/ThiF family protein [Planctomycetota bacterium]|jgi:adenylyltransferase/sulfurtransferase
MNAGRATFGSDELARYRRQMILPGWGEDAQAKLKTATVFIAGAGGLGSAVGTYLAAAGVGRIRLCDGGAVERSNLNRQTLYTAGDVGRQKVEAAGEALGRLNPHVEVAGLGRRLAENTVAELVADSGVAVDCLDNFASRLVLNEHAVRVSLPFVHAGARGMSGQLTFIKPPETPCLRCAFPSRGAAPDADADEDEALPIVGAAPGVMGSLEALEALKYLTGTGELLMGRLLVWDGAAATFEEVAVQKDPACPVCGGG